MPDAGSPPAASLAGFHCRLSPLDDLERLEADWRRLEAAAVSSFFTSWGWIGTWLATLPDRRDGRLAVVEHEGRAVAMAIVFFRTVLRWGLVYSRAAFLNCTGRNALDEITIEYNGLLALPGYAEPSLETLVQYLLNSGCDELFVDATSLSGPAPPRDQNWVVRARRVAPSHGVELTTISDHADYIARLGTNARYQLKKAMRDYARLGTMSTRAAADAREAGEWLAEMRALHQKRWNRKGLPGAFANAYLSTFHAALVAGRHDAGEVQLLRVAFGQRVLGYLYAFTWKGEVLNYQSGFDYDLMPSGNRPGTVCHAAAIEHNRARGMRYYDFLAGDTMHKRGLSTATRELRWLVFQRSLLRFRVEEWGRRLLARLRRQA